MVEAHVKIGFFDAGIELQIKNMGYRRVQVRIAIINVISYLFYYNSFLVSLKSINNFTSIGLAQDSTK
jgi:hypothetical protein